MGRKDKEEEESGLEREESKEEREGGACVRQPDAEAGNVGRAE